MIPSNTDFDTEVTLETESQPLPEDPPFHILLLGDWSGRENLFCLKLFNLNLLLLTEIISMKFFLNLMLG